MSKELLNKTKIYIREEGEDVSKRQLLKACFELPDFAQEPEMVETTTLDDDVHTSVMGVAEVDDLTYSFRIREGKDSAYNILREYVGTQTRLIVDTEFKDGERITFESAGVSISVNGGGLNEVRNFEATFSLQTPFEFGESHETDTFAFDGDFE